MAPAAASLLAELVIAMPGAALVAGSRAWLMFTFGLVVDPASKGFVFGHRCLPEIAPRHRELGSFRWRGACPFPGPAGSGRAERRSRTGARLLRTVHVRRGRHATQLRRG